MKLIFYSGGTGEQNLSLDLELLQMIGRKARITYIPTNSAGSKLWFPIFKREKAVIGLKRHLFFGVDRPFTRRELADALSSEAIFLSGGNTYYSLYHLKRSGMLSRLRTYLKQGGVLTGLSAGSIIMTPGIETAGLVPGESDDNEIGLKDWTGLGLVDFDVYPHFARSAASIRCLKRFSKKANRTVYAFPDGSGITIRDNIISFHGEITCFRQGAKFRI